MVTVPECPTKQWSRSTVEKLLRKIDRTGSVERQPGSGHLRSRRLCETCVQQQCFMLINRLADFLTW